MTTEYVAGAVPEDMFKVNFDKSDIDALAEALRDMKRPVEVLVFTEKREDCVPCEETVRLMEIIADASPDVEGSKAVRLRVFRKGHDDEAFKKYGVERVPTVLLADGAIKYTGMPAGEEVKGLVETLIRLSTGEHGLSEQTVKELAGLRRKAYIEVIVTPPCPYCPYAALMANMFAYVAKVYGSGNVIADVVEAYENPDIADKYGVTSVPTIAVNGRVVFVGLPYEGQLLRAVKRIARLGYRR